MWPLRLGEDVGFAVTIANIWVFHIFSYELENSTD